MKKTVMILMLWFTGMLVAQQPRSAPARIEGIVLNRNTNEPITGVRITLTGVNPATGNALTQRAPTIISYTNSGAAFLAPPSADSPNPGLSPPISDIPPVFTDFQGKFEITNLEAGAYRMSITANGYVRQEYQQTAFPGRGTVIALTPGQVVKDVTIRLTATGNISGRFRDSSGAPAVGVPIQLLKRTFNPQGQRILQSVGATSTNDRGEYRLYWITPGRYYLAAGNAIVAGSLGSIGRVSANDPGENFVFTLYPGVTDPAEASVIEVTPGNEIAIDFPLAKQQSFNLRGRVVDSTIGRPPATIGVSMVLASVTGGFAASSMNPPYDPATGAFEIRNVSAGTYILVVASKDATASLSLKVINHIDGLNLVLTKSLTLTGRVSIEGEPLAQGLDQMRVQLKNSTTGNPVSEVASADGTFRFENIQQGEYRVSIFSTGTKGFYIKSARFGRDDVLNGPLSLYNVQSVGSLDITVSSNVAHVEGIVVDGQLKPRGSIEAVLIPDANRDRLDLFRAVTTDPNGRFTIENVIPGDYKLFAWDTLEPNGYFDLDFVRKYESQGKLLHADESSRHNVTLNLIPPER